MTERSYNAIVIGAGHNGLITAIYLARAEWKPLVLDRNDRIGGAVRSGELTEEWFVRDEYSTNQNLFLNSPVSAELSDELTEHGLEFSTSTKPYCNSEELERDNPNLVGGDSVGGSHHLRQNFLFRPVPGWSRYAVPIDGLHMVDAATWPGAGNNATSGYLAAQRILRPDLGTQVLDRIRQRFQ